MPHGAKFLALESCREALISVRVGPAGRGSRGLVTHTFTGSKRINAKQLKSC
jgi:hypothetical protein